MVESAFQLLKEKDSFAAVEFLSSGPDSMLNARSFDAAMRQLYWSAKDLDASIAIGRAGIQFALLAGKGGGVESGNLRSLAKQIAYNVSSFCWPGWDEPGITIAPGHIAIGLDAARTNLRLAMELDTGPLALSRACWMLGAHQMASRRARAARENFQAALRHATAAAMPADELLNRGFAQLVDVLSVGDSVARLALDEMIADLEKDEEAKPFATQLRTAERVFRDLETNERSMGGEL